MLDPVELLIVQPLQVIDRNHIPCECMHGDELAVAGEVRGVSGQRRFDGAFGGWKLEVHSVVGA